MTHLNSRVARIVAGLAVVSAFAVAPMAAQAADTPVGGTLTTGGLSNSAPTINPFSTALTGVNQTVTADVGTWTVMDATGSNAGYDVNVSATPPAVDGVEADAGTGGSLTLKSSATVATLGTGNLAPATSRPLYTGGLVPTDGTSSARIAGSAAGLGQGGWNFVATDADLDVVIPGNADAGAYTSTMTYTIGPRA